MKRPWKVSWILLLITVLLGVFTLGLFSKSVKAANPTTMSFQGKVVNANGTNVSDGTYSFVFKLYTVGSGGSAIWTETQSSVTVASGIFQVSLGSACPLFVANACNSSTPIDFNANPNLYLGITFNGDPAGEMSPRVQLQSVPYAFNADKVGGLSVSQLVQLSPGSQQTGFINVSGTINGATLSGGTVSGGTLTASAVNGLNVSGTAISGSGALSVSAGGSAQNLTLDGTTTGKVQIGATSSGNIELGGGSGGSGCTLTNSNGNFLCDGTINGATLSGGTISGGTLTSSAVNSLNVSGTAISGSGSGLAISAGGTAQNLTIDAATSGKVQVGATSTGDIEIGGGSGSTGCTITNSNGNLACAGSISSTGGSLKSGSTSSAGSIVLNDGAGGSNSITLNTPTLTGSYSLTLPTAGPAVSQCLQSDSATASQLVFGDCIPLAQKLMQTYNAYAINQAATATTAMNYFLPTTATAFSIALAGTTEFRAAAAGSFRACSLINSAAVTAGTVSIHFRKNGADVSSTNYCTLNTTNTRTNSQSVASGVETFAAGDTIGIALVSSSLAPTTSEHWATFTIEYGSGGNTPTSLQDAYNNGASITTQDATDLSFNLSNTTTDANFLVNIATGSTGRFAIQNSGTDTFSVAQNGSVTSTGTINGQTISSAANFTGTLAVTTSITAPTLTSTAGLAVTGGTTLSLSSTGANIASLDSGTTGAVNLGTGNNAKTVNIGTGNAGNTINIGTNNTVADTIGIGSALDTLNISSSKFSVIGASGNLSTGGGTVNGATISGGTISGGTLTASAVNSLSVSGTAIGGTGALTVDANGANTVSIGATSTGDILLGGGSGSTGCTVTNSTGAFACSSTINGATISAGTLSGGTVSGGTLTATAVNSLNVSGTAISGTGALTIAAGGTNTALSLDGNGTGAVNVGGTSTGDIVLGGGSGSTGCTLTNASGNWACTGTVNGATLSSTTVNGLTFSGTAITGSGALAIAAGGTNTNLSLNGNGTGQVLVGGTSTGDILIGGGSASTGCTVTNSTGAFACASTINGITGFAFNGTAGLTRTCTNAGNITSRGGIITANTCTTSDIRLKDNIAALENNVLDKIKSVNVVSYDYRCYTDFFTTFQNTCPSDQQSGVIAQELAEIFPNLVHQYGSDNGNYYWVDYNALSIYTLKAVTELAQHIDSVGNSTFTKVAASNSVVTPKLISAGALAIISGSDNDISVDSSTIGTAEINIGTEKAKTVNISRAGGTTNIKGALVSEGSTDLNGDVTMHFTSPEVGFKIDNNGSAQPIENAININDSGSGYKKIINSSSFSVSGVGDVVTNGNVITKGGAIQILSSDGQQLITFDQTGSASFKGNLNLASASLSGGLSVAGDLNIAGLSSFQKMATFFAKTVFKQDVEFQGQITVSKDSAGYVLMHAGESKVHVKFNAPYTTPPVVSINAVDGQFATFSVKDITETGFDVVLKDPATSDTKLNWVALGVTDPQVSTTTSP